MSYQNSNDILITKHCWLLPQTGEVVIGNKNGDPTRPDMSHVVFSMKNFEKAVQDYKDSNATMDRDESIVAGWNPEYHGALQEIDRIRHDSGIPKESKEAAYAGVISPDFYENIQMAATNVAIYRPGKAQHGLLETIQTITVNDLNGIEFLTIDPIDQHVVNQDLKWGNSPYEVSNFGVSSQRMNVKRYGYSWSISEDLRLTRLKLDVESEILSQLQGVIELHQTEWLASLINGVTGNAASTDWDLIENGKYTHIAYDAVATQLDAINNERQSPPRYIYSNKEIAEAYLNNVTSTQPLGLQQHVRREYSFGNGKIENVPLIGGITWVYDELIDPNGTDDKIIVTSADAITRLQGPQKIVNFTNKDQSEFGTMVKLYYNLEITRPSLVKMTKTLLG